MQVVHVAWDLEIEFAMPKSAGKEGKKSKAIRGVKKSTKKEKDNAKAAKKNKSKKEKVSSSQSAPSSSSTSGDSENAEIQKKKEQLATVALAFGLTCPQLAFTSKLCLCMPGLESCVHACPFLSHAQEAKRSRCKCPPACTPS